MTFVSSRVRAGRRAGLQRPAGVAMMRRPQGRVAGRSARSAKMTSSRTGRGRTRPQRHVARAGWLGWSDESGGPCRRPRQPAGAGGRPGTTSRRTAPTASCCSATSPAARCRPRPSTGWPASASGPCWVHGNGERELVDAFDGRPGERPAAARRRRAAPAACSRGTGDLPGRAADDGHRSTPTASARCCSATPTAAPRRRVRAWSTRRSSAGGRCSSGSAERARRVRAHPHAVRPARRPAGGW